MRNIVLMIVISATAALLGPRDLHDVGDALLRAGAVVIRAGLALYRRGYDAGEKEPDDFVFPGQVAHVHAGKLS